MTDSPKNRARREAFLEAARWEFLENGYDKANMKLIVERAGGSLATMYSMFENKEGLFQAVIKDHVDTVTGPIDIQLTSEMPVDQGLRYIGRTLLKLVMTSDSRKMFRLMASAASQFPDMTRRVAFEAPEGVRRFVETYLRSRVGAGDIEIQDTYRAASTFIDMICWRVQMHAMMDPSWVLTEEEGNSLVEAAVIMFVSGARGL